MICTKCKQPIEPGDKFCPHCGAPVQKEVEQVKQCPKCGHENPAGAVFCENCGESLKAKGAAPTSPPEPKKDEPKTFTSAGNYSGTMVKGKTSKSWKRLKIILLIVAIIALIVFVIWYRTDPNAKEIMGNVLFGATVMLIFGFIIWRKAKKGKIKSSKQRNADYDWNDQDDDYDNSEDNDFDDD